MTPGRKAFEAHAGFQLAWGDISALEAQRWEAAAAAVLEEYSAGVTTGASQSSGHPEAEDKYAAERAASNAINPLTPTPQLRYFHHNGMGRLQQFWLHYSWPRGGERTGEWRDVPNVLSASE